MAMPIGVMYGLVTGISEQITPAGFAYLTMPLSGISSMIPMLFWRSASRRMPSDLGAAPRLAAAHAALVDAHVGEADARCRDWRRPSRPPGRGDRPSPGRSRRSAHGPPGVGEQPLRELGFLRRDRAWCHKSCMKEGRVDYGYSAVKLARVLRCRYRNAAGDAKRQCQRP